MIGVTENLLKIRDLLSRYALEAGRPADAVQLLAVSKKQPLEKLHEAARAGQHDFGENVVQEALAKIEATASLDVTWHFIGHLQTNKTRAVAEHFDWVHSIDRLKTARRLSAQRPEGLASLNVCLQVNIDAEQGKSGVSAEELPELAHAVSELPGLRLRGLMCLPAIHTSFEAQREPFAKLREQYESLCGSGLELDTLSMGMSGDYRAAIFEGATMVRLGTAIFGQRDT